VFSAIGSLVLYRRARTTSYVALNLLVNIGWLVMTVCLAGIIAFAYASVGR
jgi:hypothetical protein